MHDSQSLRRAHDITRRQVQHHAEVGDAADVGQNLGMSRKMQPGRMQRRFVEWRCCDRRYLAAQRVLAGAE